MIGCGVVGKGRVNVSGVCDFLIVADGMQPPWRSEAHDFHYPDLFSELANGSVQGREPGGTEEGFVAQGNGAAEDEVGVRIPPNVGV